jgi:hypothetical protein
VECQERADECAETGGQTRLAAVCRSPLWIHNRPLLAAVGTSEKCQYRSFEHAVGSGRIQNGRFGVSDATSRRSFVEIVNGSAIET